MMKTILVATDFSTASRNASLYAAQFAKAVGANIILFNAFKLSSPAAGLGVTVSRYSVMMETDKRLMEEVAALNSKETKIKIVSDEGHSAEAIINIAKEKNADLIIMGMKGSGSIFRKLLGSTATLLLKNTNIPLIIVPERATFKKPEIIVFASDAMVATHQLPPKLISFAGQFHSKLYVVNVFKPKDKHLARFTAPLHSNDNKEVIETSFYFPVDTDVDNALNGFIDKHNADMVVMTPHKHEWIELLFKKSHTTDMIFHTTIPLLVLPEEKTN